MKKISEITTGGTRTAHRTVRCVGKQRTNNHCVCLHEVMTWRCMPPPRSAVCSLHKQRFMIMWTSGRKQTANSSENNDGKKKRNVSLSFPKSAKYIHTHTLNTLFLFLGRWTNVTRLLLPLPPRVRRRRYYYVCAHRGENVRLLVINPDTKWTLFSCLVGIWKRRESAVLWAKRGEKKDNRSVCYCCTVCLKTLEKKKKRESILSPDATKKENKALL